MSTDAKWNGKTALVTGASAGIGEAFAHLLAQSGCHLILVARRRDRLEALAEKLRDRYGVTVDVIAVDLATPEAAGAVFAEVAKLGRAVDLLINNAGFGIDGRFSDHELARELAMIQLNVVALVELTKRFLPGMLQRGRGDILLVSSIAAFVSMPTFATYAATKAFVTSFGEAIGHELRGTGVTVTVLNPGGTRTEFLDVAGMKPTKLTQLGLMPAETVARIGLRAMARGRRSVIAGLANAAAIFVSTHLLPLDLRLRSGQLFQRLAGGGGPR
ncbi:MAG: SDR family oxidoreductase [Candidatus Schekmanbacteria bacterium]|nr:SDR family oxidoreductase [Candidatus Schekmanbacteria bacterium]